jgi:hypothetical protein
MSLKSILFGREKSLTDRNLFHSLSLIAVFAWVGLGADGLSSSCYGPEETFKALGGSTHLSLFVALASVITIVAICASYSQIISLFPTGGGGYLVASKLLSPATGVVSGSSRSRSRSPAAPTPSSASYRKGRRPTSSRSASPGSWA